jgi:hypothetical protein
MALPKWAESQLDTQEKEIERLKRRITQLVDEKALLARQLEIAQTGWTDEAIDGCRKAAGAGQ